MTQSVTQSMTTKSPARASRLERAFEVERRLDRPPRLPGGPPGARRSAQRISSSRGSIVATNSTSRPLARGEPLREVALAAAGAAEDAASAS